MNVRDYLSAGLETGFIDLNLTSLEQYHPKLLVNDHKRGVKVLSSIIQELRTCEEFYFSVAFITNSGVASLINILKELDDGGKVKGKILTSQYQNFTDPRALKRLLQFKNIQLRIETENNFHAKGYIFKRSDRYSFIIGSSNMTQNALSLNKEWNVKFTSMPEGLIMQNILTEFNNSFQNATPVNEKFIEQYSKIYGGIKETFAKIEREGGLYEEGGKIIPLPQVLPNKMQVEAMSALEMLRKDGKDKALLVSATGTGKTYLSAFDAANEKPSRLLFVIHRENIARAALESYKRIFLGSKSMGLFTGNSKDTQKDFLFSTIQTLSKDDNLNLFARDEFDYIIIDEVHRSGAESYQKVLNYFKPKFLLGMSATPERTDGYDIFKHFDYNIAYEIRLHRALEENMLAPFHYYGVSELEIDGQLIDDATEFNRLVSEERVKHIIEKAKFYGCDRGRIKGLIFCSRIEEAHALSAVFNKPENGFKTVALDGTSSEDAREDAIKRLEQDHGENSLDYIFTVDIFNEGVDIPAVNQIIMLRPTQSAIIFVQQLGRGLRKIPQKEYLTVIDFIGNYSNNYLIPIALYGDQSYNKDTIRQLVNSENSLIPGSSTINFDFISREKIFKSIDANNLSTKRDMKKDYMLLKYELGRIPSMMDFLDYGRREPYSFIRNFGSYYHFLISIGEAVNYELDVKQQNHLAFFSKEILNGKRIEEGLLLAELMANKEVRIEDLSSTVYNKYGYKPSEKTWSSAVRNLNGLFSTTIVRNKYNIIEQIGQVGSKIYIEEAYRQFLISEPLAYYLNDMIRYSNARFTKDYSKDKFRDGFLLNAKYGRKDVCRILNWERNEEGTLFGYRIKYNTCPMFVTYNKEEDISATTKYRDEFINAHQFSWMTRNRVTLESTEVKQIKDPDVRKLLFVKKSDGEGTDFYYLGDVQPLECHQTTILSDKNKELPIVNIYFQMEDSVNESLYNYLTT